MNKVEVVKVLASISYAYDRFEFDEGKVELWAEMLQDQIFEDVMASFKKHAKKERFPPTISELVNQEKETEDRNVVSRVNGGLFN